MLLRINEGGALPSLGARGGGIRVCVHLRFKPGSVSYILFLYLEIRTGPDFPTLKLYGFIYCLQRLSTSAPRVSARSTLVFRLHTAVQLFNIADEKLK